MRSQWLAADARYGGFPAVGELRRDVMANALLAHNGNVVSAVGANRFCREF